MTTTLWLSLVAKALATALIVMSAATAAEALGPVWSAIIASLPVSAGPAYVFLAMQHGADFVAASAINSAAANAATGLFLITYAILAKRMSSWRSLGTAVAVWFITSLLIQHVVWTPVTAAALNLVVYTPGLVFANNDATAAPEPPQFRRRWFDLPIRATAVAAFVACVVAVSAVLGPAATGIAAVFPVSLISLIVTLRPRLGTLATARLAANALAPMLGFGGMLLVLHLVTRPLGVTASLSLAMTMCVLWSCLLLLQARGGWFRA